MRRILLVTFLLSWFAVIQPATHVARPLCYASAQSYNSAQVHKTAVSAAVSARKSDKMIVTAGDQKKIAEFVGLIQKGSGPKYTNHVANTIIREAVRYNIDPYIITTTAYIESGFNMKDRPCIGIMQIEPATYRGYKKKYKIKLNPHKLEDNIQLGTLILVNKSVSRSTLSSRGGYDRKRMALMWGRYNGSGSDGFYVHRAMRTMSRIKKGNVKTWKDHINKYGSLWSDKK